MRFEWPVALLSLALVPLVLAAYVLVQRRPSRYAVVFPNLDVLAGVVERREAWRRWVPPAVFLLALALLGIALARPHVAITVDRERGTVVLGVDTSASMLADDVSPTRLQAAQGAVHTFLDDLPGSFRVGMVAFAGDAQVVAPVTSDRSIPRQAVDYLVPLRGTAIGDAVARAAELASEAVGGPGSRQLASLTTASRRGTGPPAAVLLLSDGYQTAGTLFPLDGAARARELGIPVYTIALGTDEGTLSFGDGREIHVPPDRETLRRIAEETNGRYFDAPTAEALRSAYAELGSLLAEEPGETEATFAFLAAAAVLGLLAAGLSALWLSRIP